MASGSVQDSHCHCDPGERPHACHCGGACCCTGAATPVASGNVASLAVAVITPEPAAAPETILRTPLAFLRPRANAPPLHD